MKKSYPKLIKAEVLTNNMIHLTFDNNQEKYLRSHLLNDIVGSYSLKKDIPRRVLLFGTPYLSAYGSKYEIQNDGSLLLNNSDMYTPQELWENSKSHIYN